MRKRPGLHIVDFVARMMDVWLRSSFGAGVTTRLEALGNHWRTSRLKSGLASCGSGVSFQWPILIDSPERVEIGDAVSFAAYVHIWGSGGVQIGDRVMIGSHAAISSVTHDYRSREMRETVVLKPVIVGADVWIGSHAVIMPGLTIGQGAVIGSGCVVTHDVDAWAIVVGMPGREVGRREV
jgi:acetyltransferase-like isoleucine patch superfamily enzyme